MSLLSATGILHVTLATLMLSNLTYIRFVTNDTD